LNMNLEELDSFMEKYEEIKLNMFDLNSELNAIGHELIYKNELIEQCNIESDEKEKKLNDKTYELQNLDKNITKLSELYKGRCERVDNVEEEKRKRILLSWVNAFDKIIIEKNDLKNISRFNIDQLLEIEKCIFEINSMEDPEALSNGFVKEGKEKYEYTEIENNGFRFEVWYEVYKGGHKNIHIIKVL